MVIIIRKIFLGHVHVGGPYIHVGDYMIPVPYKVRGDHQNIHVGRPYIHVEGPYNTCSHIRYGGP